MCVKADEQILLAIQCMSRWLNFSSLKSLTGSRAIKKTKKNCNSCPFISVPPHGTVVTDSNLKMYPLYNLDYCSQQQEGLQGIFPMPYYFSFPTSVSTLARSLTKQVKIISRAAFLLLFHQSVGTSAVKVAKCVSFVEMYLEGGWCRVACFQISHKRYSRRSSSPWLGMIISCCHSLHRHTSLKNSTPETCQIVDEDRGSEH